MGAPIVDVHVNIDECHCAPPTLLANVLANGYPVLLSQTISTSLGDFSAPLRTTFQNLCQIVSATFCPPTNISADHLSSSLLIYLEDVIT